MPKSSASKNSQPAYLVNAGVLKCPHCKSDSFVIGVNEDGTFRVRCSCYGADGLDIILGPLQGVKK
jgi:hypothetical protein